MSDNAYKLKPTRLPKQGSFKTSQNVDLPQRFPSNNLQKKPEIELGSLWTLSLPEMGTKDKSGHHIYAVHEVAHKEGRPYLVLSSKEQNNLSGIVCVAPLTTFSSRFQPPPLYEGVCVEIRSTPDRTYEESFKHYDGYKFGFVNLANLRTYSSERFQSYLHTISKQELDACKDVLDLLLGKSNKSTAQKLFPDFDISELN
jgi:mRNA-degrading endonuclease toxin of MazEF toxin-antitoxin module